MIDSYGELMSSILICIASLITSAVVLWQADKAICFHICAARSARTRQDLAQLMRGQRTPLFVSMKIIPAALVFAGVALMTILNHSMVGLVTFSVGVVVFCVASTFHAYAALNRNSVS
jgi:hypothetical protein